MPQPRPAASNGLGVAGFVVSLVGLVTCLWIICPIGLILSFIAMFRRPRGMAIAGFIIGLLGSLWIILIVALSAFALFIPRFFQIGIFLNIVEQSTFVGIIAVGLSLTLIAGHLGLSIESVMALAAMLVALTVGTGGAGGGLALSPSFLAFPVSLAMALGVGAHALCPPPPPRDHRRAPLSRPPPLPAPLLLIMILLLILY